MKEIYKDIPNYEGKYQVSNLGNVKSYWYTNNKILKPTKSSNGYLTVSLVKDDKKSTFTVHKLVSMVFLNHIPCKQKLVVNHIDFNRLNNNVNNLEIVTTRENTNLKHIKSSSKYVGVCWSKQSNKWHSTIRIKGILKHLGFFINEHDAHLAYQNELKTII